MTDSKKEPLNGKWEYPENYCQLVDDYLAPPEHFSYTFHDNSLIIAIKGTSNPQQWVDKAKTRLVAFGGDQAWGWNSRRVHRGFLDMFNEAVEFSLGNPNGVLFALQQEKAKLANTNSAIIVGHSLGAAFAIFLAYTWSKLGQQIPGLPAHIDMIVTFGSPKVGNKRFKEDYEREFKNSYRVANKLDPVPLVPVRPQYFHSGVKEILFTHGTLKEAHGSYWGDVHSYL